jgi:4-amino-4-deoxy-L-arabinose transferase-like glycosyltransferase
MRAVSATGAPVAGRVVRKPRASELAARAESFLRSPAGVSFLLGFAFVLISLWWISADTRLPTYDSGRHTNIAIVVHDTLAAHQWTRWFTNYTIYPPLVHLVGGLSLFPLHFSLDSPLVAQNLVFVPLLVVSLHRLGTKLCGGWAGPLAVAFALATPMLIDQFHEFMLDAPLCSFTAATAWLLVESKRFERTGIAALAGLAVGLGLNVKQPFVFFVAGFLAVAVLRGGWRRPKGLAAFGAVAFAIGAPWYLHYFDAVQTLSTGAFGGVPAAAHNPLSPPRYSSDNLLWYFWNALNVQLLLPLCLFALVGAVAAVARFVRTPSSEDWAPELLGGLVVGWAGMTYISLKDPRYTLALTAYLAILGTWWIARGSTRVRWFGAATLTIVLVCNTLAVSFGTDLHLKSNFRLLSVAPKANINEGGFRLWSHGYTRGGPNDDLDFVSVMRQIRGAGPLQVAFEGGGSPAFNGDALDGAARVAGLVPTRDATLLSKRDVYVFSRPPQSGEVGPCMKLPGGEDVYIRRDGKPFCPPYR